MDALRQAVSERLLVDLAAHDVSHELRDPATGRWIKTLGAAKLAELSEAGRKALGSEDEDETHYGSFKGEQVKAQRKAGDAYLQVAESSVYDNPERLLDMKPSPERSWGVYQLDGGYQAINDELRKGPGKGILFHIPITESPTSLAANMVKAFDTMGYTTKRPAVLYRTVDSKNVPLDTLTAGGLFQDTGVISCSADSDEIAGLLDGGVPGDASIDVDNPILLKINVPAGTRVLGGSPGGIETMLKPGTKFKVVSHQKSKKIGGYGQPGYPGYIGKHTLPMVTLEVIPDD